jgi:hypothetical protein
MSPTNIEDPSMKKQLSPEVMAESVRDQGRVDTPEPPVTVLRTSVDINSV